MTKKQLVTIDDVKHLAKLANLPLSDERLMKLVGQIETTFEYIQTLEKTDTSKLVVKDDTIWQEDDWEVFFSRQRGRPYCQIGVNAHGVHEDLLHDTSMVKWDSGSQVVSDAEAPDRWTVYISVPLTRLLPDGASPGETLYMNILRATPTQDALAWIPTYAGFHEPDRFGEVVLAP